MQLLLVVNASAIALAYRLLLSHLIADFVSPTAWLTPQSAIQGPSFSLQRSWLAGLLAYLFAFHWGSIWIFPLVTLLHGLVDWVIPKPAAKPKYPFRYSIANQAAHLITLLCVWLIINPISLSDLKKLFYQIGTDHRVLALATGYVLCTYPIGLLIGVATKKWQDEILSSSQAVDRASTLVDAGKWIGIAERVLIFSLVLVGQYESIGFLIAAKSLLRFKDGASKYAEYVLIGTLLSFGLAILVGIVVRKIIA